MIELDHIRKEWGTAVALADISLAIAAGSFTVLLGPSGCGKSTCLRIVAGLEEASSGRVLLDGRDVTALPPARRGVAMVFQSYALFPHLTVAENIMFGLRARRVPAPERRRRLAEASEMLGIGHLLARRPSQLSGGQQQRVALGRAIVAEAPICLMDEPLSNLDALLRAEMRREILALQRRLGLTMLFVTHDQTEAMSMADQIVLLRDGRIEQDATPEQLYAHPETSFAAGFIGAPPMNLLPLERRGDGMVIGGTDGPVLCGATARAVVGGLRPEALSLSASGIAARVTLMEFLGAETVLTCVVGAAELRVLMRLPGRAAASPGAAVHLHAAPDALHLFDAATGKRIARDLVPA